MGTELFYFLADVLTGPLAFSLFANVANVSSR